MGFGRGYIVGKSEAKIYQQCSFCFRFVLLLVLYSEPEIGRKEEMQSGKRHTTIFPLVPGREYKTGPTTAVYNARKRPHSRPHARKGG